MSLKHKTLLLEALRQEIALTRDALCGQPVSTIYFGGGTPSLLMPEELKQLLNDIRQAHTIADGCEITLEANPDDVTPQSLNAWINAGFNRISLGVQSFHEADLLYLDRKHNPQMALQALELIAKANLISCSVDLIYGIPGQSPEHFSENLELCARWGIPHLSCYALTIEPNTPLAVNIRKKQKIAPDEESFTAHWEQLANFATSAGYLHYETSNLCLPNHFARHNISYWNNTPYLGLGPSAHSYYPNTRWWNHASLKQYLEGVANGSAIASREELTTSEQYNEFLMTRLRTLWGIREKEFTKQFGSELRARLIQDLQPMIKSGWIRRVDDSFTLTPNGKIIEDHVISSLFINSESES